MKKLLSLIICIALAVQGVMLTAAAEEELYDLTKTGSYMTTNRSTGDGEKNLENLTDGNDNSYFIGRTSSGGGLVSDSYVQVNFPSQTQVKKIRVAIGANLYYAIRDIHISLSNTSDFSEDVTEVYRTEEEYINSDDTVSIPAYSAARKNGEIIIEGEALDGLGKYKYLRVEQNGISSYFGLSEVTVYADRQELENVSLEGELLSDYPDIECSVSGSTANSIADKMLDHNTEIPAITATSTEKYSWIRIDLQRQAYINGVRVTLAPETLLNTSMMMFLSNRGMIEDSIINADSISASMINDSHSLIFQYGAGGIRDGSFSTLTDNTEGYRYLWLLASDEYKSIIVNEIEIYGEYMNSTRNMKNLAADAVITAMSNQESVNNINDNDLDSIWMGNGEYESIVFDLNDEYNISKIGILPILFDNGSFGNNINIEFSNDAEFIEKELVYESSDNEFSPNKITYISPNVNNSYRYVRITKTVSGQLGFAQIRIITNDITNSFGLDDQYPLNSEEGVTNTNSHGVFSDGMELSGEHSSMILSFSKALDESTVSSNTIVLEANRKQLGYTENDYDVDGKIFTLDLSALNSDTEYTVTITSGLKSIAGDSFSPSMEFKFTTGMILKGMPEKNGEIVNIGTGKDVIYLNKDETAVSGYPEEYVTDGDDTTGCVMNISDRGKYSYIIIDLMNVYDIFAFEIKQRAGMGHDLKNAEIVASDAICDISEMKVIDTIGSEGAINNTHIAYSNDYMGKYRYVGVRRIGDPVGVGVSELKVWSYTDKDFMPWRVVYDKKPAVAIENDGVYTVSTAIRNTLDTMKSYGFFINQYDKDGKFVGMIAKNINVSGRGKEDISVDVNVDGNISKLKCIIIDSTASPSVSMDCYTVSR